MVALEEKMGKENIDIVGYFLKIHYHVHNTYKDIIICPHHVFRMEGQKIIISIILIINTAFLFEFALEKIALI